MVESRQPKNGKEYMMKAFSRRLRRLENCMANRMAKQAIQTEASRRLIERLAAGRKRVDEDRALRGLDPIPVLPRTVRLPHETDLDFTIRILHAGRARCAEAAQKGEA